MSWFIAGPASNGRIRKKMRNHPLNARLTDRAYDASEAMHMAAVAGFYACERFGKDSPEHKATRAPYEALKAAYETICREDGIEPYLDPCQFFS
jgi:hypothetical protein